MEKRISLKRVHEQLTELKNTSKKLEKIRLLKIFLKDRTFLRVIKYALNQTWSYKTKSLKKDLPKVDSGKTLWQILNYLRKKNGANNEDKSYLHYAASVDEETFDVVTRIINKDLKCGCGPTLINKAAPNTIFVWPYMRCSDIDEKSLVRFQELFDRGGYAYEEKKADGAHIDIVCLNGKISLKSRYGQTFDFHGNLIEEYKKLSQNKDIVFIGEGLILQKDGTHMSRKKGNGIIGKGIRNTISKEEAGKIVTVIWDVIPYDSFMEGYDLTPQHIRHENLLNFFSSENISEKISLIECRKIYSIEQGYDFYKEMRLKKFEGSILKHPLGEFKAGWTSPWQLKQKASHECEVYLTGWKYGKKGGKYEKCIGSLCYKSEDDLVIGDMSGLTDEERGVKFTYDKNGKLVNTEILQNVLDEWTNSIGKVISAEFNDLVDNDTTPGLYSLYLPRFSEKRFDKFEADDFEYIKKLSKK